MTRTDEHESDPPGVRHPPHLLRAAGLLAGAVALVMLLSLLLAPGQPYRFDRATLLALRMPNDLARGIGPDWLPDTMRDITTLGGGTVLKLVVAGAAVMLAASRKWLTTALMLAGTIGGSVAVRLLKGVIERPRPEIVPHLVEVSSLSFPSGHAANSAIVYLTLATLVTQIADSRAQRNAVLVLAALLVTAIGVSRCYLGVHWPSDVLAGWSFGTLWALAWWQAGKWARKRQDALPAMPVDETES